jgi:hypothetical protein
VAARQCPNCLAMVSVTAILTRSNDLVCAGCGKGLEVGAASRYIAAFTGLAAGALGWRASVSHYSHGTNSLGWALPVLFAVLAFGLVSLIVLAFAAELWLRSVQEAPAVDHAVQTHPTSISAHH